MKNKIGKICLLIYSFMFGCISSVHAATLFEQLYLQGGGQNITNAAALVAGWIRYGAIAVAVGVLMVKGVKFMISSPDGKAEVKKEMIPWAIGLLILFTFNIVIDIIVNLGMSFSYNNQTP